MSYIIHQPLLSGTFLYFTPEEAKTIGCGTFHLFDVSAEILEETPLYSCLSILLSARSITERDVRLLSMTSKPLWNSLQPGQTLIKIRTKAGYDLFQSLISHENNKVHLPFFSIKIAKQYSTPIGFKSLAFIYPRPVLNNSPYLKNCKFRLYKTESFCDNIDSLKKLSQENLTKITKLWFAYQNSLDAGIIYDVVQTIPNLQHLSFSLGLEDNNSEVADLIKTFCESPLISDLQHLTYTIRSDSLVYFQTIKPLIQTLPHLKLPTIPVAIQNGVDYSEYNDNDIYQVIEQITLYQYRDITYLKLLGITLAADDTHLKRIYLREIADDFKMLFEDAMSQPESSCIYEIRGTDEAFSNSNIKIFLLTPLGKKIDLDIYIEINSAYWKGLPSENLKHLTLDISHLNSGFADILAHYTQNHPNISSLTINGQYNGNIGNIESMPILEKLVSLKLNGILQITYLDMVELIKKMPNLEQISIEFCGGSVNETQKILSHLYKRHPHLKPHALL